MNNRSMIYRILCACALTICGLSGAQAQDTQVAAATQGADPSAPVITAPDVVVTEGPVTRLPLPRYVSLKARESNVRRGPSLTHRIDWVFKRRHMPLQVVAEYGHWRRVIDREGQGGWVHYTMLSGVRQVIVDQDRLMLRSHPEDSATGRAELEAGVIARLSDCNADWCELSAGGYRGWAPKTAVWGVDADELRD